MDNIINYILNNQSITNYLSKQTEDMRQDFYTTILEWIHNDGDKKEMLVKLYNKDELGKYCMGMIRNGSKPNSPWFIKYNKKYSDIDLTNYYQIDEEYEEIDYMKKINKIIKILNSLDFYHSTLYKLKIGISPLTEEIVQPLSYHQIQELIGISYTSVRNSCIKTEKIIKEKLK